MSRRALAGCMLVLGVLVGLMLPAGALAMAGSIPADSYVTNGQVSAVAQSGGTLFLGGSFTQVGPRTGGFVGVSGTSGQASAPYPQVTGAVRAMAADGSGGYFIGGSFTAVGGLPIDNAAHIHADGTLDLGWNPHVNSTVMALVVSGSTVYLGGGFTHVTDATGTTTVARRFAAAVDATNGRDTGWNPNPNDAVQALAVSGSGATVYLGGQFTQVTDSTGTGTIARNNAAAVDSTNGRDTGWNPNPDNSVDALTVSGSTVYLGGYFTQVTDSTGTTTAARNHAAAVDATNGRDTGWNPNPDAIVLALAVSGSTVYLGGNFSQVTDSTGTGTIARSHAAAVDATNGRDTGWNPNPDDAVLALAVSGSTVYLGGDFTQVTDSTGTTAVTRSFAAAVDATTGHDTGWNPNANDGVLALAVSGSTVYLGGAFSSVNGVARRNAAALDSAGTVTGWDPNADGSVLALAVSGSTVYLGGFFTQVTDSTGATTATRNHAAAVDATNGRDTGWNPNPDNGVLALAVSGSTVYLGGYFSHVTDATGATTVSRSNAAAVDAANGRDTGWNPNPDSTVDALAVSGSTVYLGGNFTQVTDSAGTATVTRNHAAAVDATHGRDTGWNPNTNDAVQALAVSGSTVYLGGSFTAVGLSPQSNIAEFQILAPTPPTALSTIPASQGKTTTPKVTGTAEPGSTVNVYSTPDCSGSPDATGTAADFGSTGLTVAAVAAGSTTTYYATATDAGLRTSVCSSDHASYTQLSPSLSAVSAPGTGTVGSAISASSVSAGLSGGSAPSGMVTFEVFGPQPSAPTDCSTGGTTVGTASVNGDGTYHPSVGFTPTSAGDYWWYASYGGDGSNSSANSGCGGAMTETTVSSASAPKPSSTAPPTIAGTAARGQKLTESHGAWTGGPSAYSYQWYACDSAGAHCAAITGATGPTLVLTADQVGHTIRVAEGASNASGASDLAVSAATAAVSPPSALLIGASGVGSRAGATVRPGITLSCTGTVACDANETATVRIARDAYAPHSNRTVSRTVGLARFSIPAGASIPATFTLNALGRLLVADHKRLTVALGVSGAPRGGPPVTSTSTIVLNGSLAPFKVAHLRVRSDGSVSVRVWTAMPGHLDLLVTAWHDNVAPTAGSRPVRHRFVVGHARATARHRGWLNFVIEPTARARRLITRPGYRVVLRAVVGYTPPYASERQLIIRGRHPS